MKKALNLLKKRWYLFVIILAVSGFLFYRQQVVSSQNKGNPYKVKKETLRNTLTFSGHVDADEKANLQFQTGGRLVWVGVKEGDYVKKYQAIASLDQRQLKKTMQRYLNTYVKTRLSFDQKQDNSSDVGGLSTKAQTELQRLAEEAQMDLNNSVIDVELENITLEYANLYTPIEGVVDHVDTPVAGVNISAVSPSTFRIVNPATLYFTADADQTDVIKLQEGQDVEINFDAYPDENIPAVIKSIAFSPTEGETGTVYGVKMNFLDNSGDKNYRYRLGMTGDANLVLREIPDVISVPATYIKSEKDKQYVMKDVKGKAEKIYVSTGETIDNQTVITSGLQEGDTIYD